MATVVDVSTGLYSAAISGATTVIEFTLPAYTRSVAVATAASSADFEASWVGTAGAASFASGFVTIPSGGSWAADIGPDARGATTLFLRPKAVTSTIVSITCSWRAL